MKRTEIKKIHSIFTHNNKFYVLFEVINSNYNYLYIFNPETQNRSLLYGNHLISLISKYSKNISIGCLECKLGSQLIGAVSLDNGNIIQSNLSLEKANIILEKLKEKIGKQRDIIQIF